MQTNTSIAEQTIVVILAAGKGTRMGRSDLCKVCFEIDSVPAIIRTINVFKKKRFKRFLIVVGSKSDQVLETVTKEHPGILYVHQEPQLGTGHAAKLAADALDDIGYTGNVLLAMGDKFLQEEAIETLVTGHIKQQADFSLLTLPKTKGVFGGQVFVDKNGQALDIIEIPDIGRQSIVDELSEHLDKGKTITSPDIQEIVDRHIPNAKKQTKAVGKLLGLAKPNKSVNVSQLKKLLHSDEYNISIQDKRYSAKEVEKLCKDINPSMYLLRHDVFHRGVHLIDNNNAQHEFYVTDIIKCLAALKDDQGKSQYRIRAIRASNANWVQGFNSPDELLTIQDYVRRQKVQRRKKTTPTGRPNLKSNQYSTVTQWLTKIDDNRPSIGRWLHKIYGQHDHIHKDKIKSITDALRCYGKRFSFDDKVCIVRAPGRINLMGRHIDHRGGTTNFLAIDRETIAVAGLRSDNNVVAVSVEPKKFKPVEFNVSEVIGNFAWSDWINFVDSDWVRNMLRSTAGNWGNYVKAAMLRLQHKYQDVKVRGLNLAVTGNVPIAAGLSSSSTLVVATLQAAIAMNNFNLTSQQFIDLCGEGEWFVGSRGGAADHAAIYLGQRGKIANVGYLPFRVGDIIEAPNGYQVIVANSHITAAKSSAAKDEFNSKIASYNLGFALLKQRCPEFADSLEYVRDINPETLGCATSDIYRMLLKIPQLMTRKDFSTMLSKEHRHLLEINFASHAEPKYYNPRGVVLFGAAEVMRSRIAVDYLAKTDTNRFGRLMQVSHDGDRVSKPGSNGDYELLPETCSDNYLNRLIVDLASEDPERVLNAQLYMQPGCYACSTPQIDRMVDIARSIPGVVGAQIAGAGLGGCIMVFAEKSSVDTVRKALTKHYYRPAGLKPAMITCIAAEGAGLVEF